MDRVMDALLSRLESHPPGTYVVLGVAPDGHELRAAQRYRSGLTVEPGEVVPPYLTVCVEVPEVPEGRVELVLCRWSDGPHTMMYHSVSEGAPRPRWTKLKLTPDGVRLTVQWGLEEPRVYEYAWTTESVREV